MKKSLLFGLILFVASAGLAFADGFKATTEPVVLPAGTYGSYGTKGNYVLFGDWPQSLKAKDVTVSSDKEDVNGWECYKGSDGCYYVMAVAESFVNGGVFFDNGTKIENGESNYFKLEPIKWRIVTDSYQGGKLLVAENILAVKRFDKNSNNYKNSEIRSWLNDDFINSAFTKEAIESINTVTVDNSVKSTGYSENEYACENTEDKIFLLSSEEVTSTSYGFNSNPKIDDIVRIRKTTDYSRATGAFSNANDNGWWVLRSPFYISNYSTRDVNFAGSACYFYGVDSTYRGIVPALSISF